jgi:hypothetical protein
MSKISCNFTKIMSTRNPGSGKIIEVLSWSFLRLIGSFPTFKMSKI